MFSNFFERLFVHVDAKESQEEFGRTFGKFQDHLRPSPASLAPSFRRRADGL